MIVVKVTFFTECVTCQERTRLNYYYLTSYENYSPFLSLNALFQIKAEVNKLYRLLELDVDGVFKYMLLLKKKKYAALTVSKLPNGKMVTERELKGLDIVRRDWSQLASNAGKYVIDQILSDMSLDERVAAIHTYLEELGSKLREGKVSGDIAH